MNEVIFGPPGTGKTRALIERIAAHIVREKNPRVLLCSHTRAAAREAYGRWGLPDKIDIQTLHSYCFKALGLTPAQTVTDYKLRAFAEEFGLDMDDSGDGRTYIDVISYSAATKEPIAEAYARLGSPGQWQHFKAFVESYNKWKEVWGYVDFNDMLDRYLTSPTRSDYSMVAIDEAQDLTPKQWLVIGKILSSNTRPCLLTMGMDDDQALYVYAGADPHRGHEFAMDQHCDTTILNQSYRLPESVHVVATRIAERLSKRVNKQYTPRPEVGSVQFCGDITNLNVDQSRDTLVLYSDKFVREEVEDQLYESAVPYTATGGKLAPLQTATGRAISIARRGTPDGNEIRTIRAALNARGAGILDAVGINAVCQKLSDLDDSIVRDDQHMDYFERVDFAAPVNVRISTIHAAKGAQADDVHLITQQSNAAINHTFVDADAQHRQFYVGVTRTHERLFVYEGSQSNYPVLT